MHVSRKNFFFVKKVGLDLGLKGQRNRKARKQGVGRLAF